MKITEKYCLIGLVWMFSSATVHSMEEEQGVQAAVAAAAAYEQQEEIPRQRQGLLSLIVNYHFHIGNRPAMEDRYHISLLPDFNNRYGLCVVCDGHSGADAAEFVSKNIASYLAQALQKRRSSISQDGSSIKAALHETFRCLESDMRLSSVKGGTTTLAALIDREWRRLYVANVGDSRAVLGSHNPEQFHYYTTQLSHDHKPDDERERRRLKIIGMGIEDEFVDAYGFKHHAGEYDDYGIKISARMPCGLAMSRVMGDFDLKAKCVGLIAVPEIFEKQLCKDDVFLVLASDGIWDIYSNDAVNAIVFASKSHECGKMIINHALTFWKEVSEKKHVPPAADNMTAIVAFFKQKNEAPR